MSEYPINPVDALVIGAVLLSGVLALIRGLVREVLSLISWSISIWAGIKLAPYAKPFMLRYTENDMVASGAAGVSMFLLVLIILTIISHFISRSVRKSSLSAIDRSLGFVFGAIRGYLVVVLIYLAGTLIFTNNKDYPVWLTEAKTEPALHISSDWLQSMMPAHFKSDLNSKMDDARAKAQKAKDDKEELDRLTHIQEGQIGDVTGKKRETPVEKAVDQAAPKSDNQ